MYTNAQVAQLVSQLNGRIARLETAVASLTTTPVAVSAPVTASVASPVVTIDPAPAYFSATGAALREQAAAGDGAAQAELDRRAAKRAAKAAAK